MEDHKRLIGEFTEFLGAENVMESKVPRERRVFVTIKTDKLRDAVKYLKDHEGLTHITTITGIDSGDEIEVLYHLAKKDLSLGLRVMAPMEEPVVDSIVDIFNGAGLYEREVHDILGVAFEGHPDMKRLILPDEWPEGVHPLLKKWTLNKIRETIDGKEW
ncbi:MAG: NADH-quinone oxidoreductase subunit C [Candidatus Bathyarchaeota archaeon]|nr:NADH-quinone oxidoreductase subunit C [Candidatus Bathyarchaeota archaeon]